MTLCVVVFLAVSFFWVTVTFLSISWSVEVSCHFLFAIKLESRALLRSREVVSPARLSSACARHSWCAFSLNFLVDVFSEILLEVRTVAKKFPDTLQLVIASWIDRVANETVFSLCMSQLQCVHPAISC